MGLGCNEIRGCMSLVGRSQLNLFCILYTRNCCQELFGVVHGTGIDFGIKYTVYDFRQIYHLRLKEVLLMADVKAPMPGKICEVKVSPGDTVIEDQEVLVLEAMKMEMPIVATAAGTVKSVNCATGDAVQGGDVLMVID